MGCHYGDNQTWDFFTRGNNEFVIVNWHSGKFLEVLNYSLADGAPLRQWDCHYGPNQVWRLQESGVGTDKFLVNLHSNKLLEIYDSATHDGAAAVQWGLNGNPNQRWQLT